VDKRGCSWICIYHYISFRVMLERGASSADVLVAFLASSRRQIIRCRNAPMCHTLPQPPQPPQPAGNPCGARISGCGSGCHNRCHNRTFCPARPETVLVGACSARQVLTPKRPQVVQANGPSSARQVLTLATVRRACLMRGRWWAPAHAGGACASAAR